MEQSNLLATFFKSYSTCDVQVQKLRLGPFQLLANGVDAFLYSGTLTSFFNQ